jgi:hypothetical protein
MPSADSHLTLAAVQRLRRVTAALATGTPPPADDAEWFAQRLATYLSNEGELALDFVLGIAAAPGKLSWRLAEKHAERDRLLRELAGPGPGAVLRRAQELQRRLRRYAASSWSRDRARKSPSATNELLYRIFCLDPDPPTGISRLRDIIR